MFLVTLRFREVGFLFIISICLSIVIAESLKNHNFTAILSNSSMAKYSSDLRKEKEKNIKPEYVREYNVAQRWQSMETTFIKIITAMYNDSLPVIIQITKDLDISLTCKKDLMKMVTGINEFKYWAVQMLDSFGKIPVGIETGTFNSLGDFDQCLEVDVPGHFQGQYCNLDMIMPMPKREPFVSTYTEVPEIMNAVKPDGYFSAFGKYGRLFYLVNPRVSICVPSTCSRGELQKIANRAVKTMNFSFGLSIPNCEILNKDVEFDRVEIIIMIILATLILLVISATAVDVWLDIMFKEEDNKKLSLPTKYLLCFSLYTNTERLIRTDTEKDSITVFHGMRVLTTVWVIYSHSCYMQNFKSAGSLRNIEKNLKMPYFQTIANSFANVQTFFFMSATVHTYHTIKDKKKLNIRKKILRRMWRLAPTFMLMIGFVILMPHFGSGPIWKETVENLLSTKCRDKWWTNLLFINNFVPSKDMCLIWLWYIAADFQLYLLSFLVLVPMKRNPVLGFSINTFIMVIAMIISGILHVYYNLTPMLILAFTHYEDAFYYFDQGYFRSYLHCSSICMGMAVGYFLANRKSKLRIPKKINVLLLLASLGIPSVVLFGTMRWSQGHLPSIWVSVLYAGGGKILWTAGMAWITIACMTGNGGIIAKLLSLPIFVPLGRLCYVANIMHPLIHYMHIGSRRTIFHTHLRSFVHIFCGNIFLSFLFAFPISLLIEQPFVALDKLLFSEKKTVKTQPLKTLDSEYSEAVLFRNKDIKKDMENQKKAA